MRRVIANGSVLLLGLLASLLLAEAALRLVAGPDFGSPTPTCDDPSFRDVGIVLDPVLGWRNVPGPWSVRCGAPPEGSADAVVDAMGFRGPEVAPDKPRGVVRIVCLGDSGTFGVQAIGRHAGAEGVVWRAVEAYPAALRKRLSREGLDHVEVINAGVIGYTSSHGLRLLALRIRDLEPDVVTLRFGANDATAFWAPARRSIEPGSPVLRTALYRLDEWRLLRLLLRAYQGAGFLHPEPFSVRGTTETQFRHNLERFAELAADGGFRLLLLDYALGPLPPRRPGEPRPLVRMQLAERLPGLQRIQAEVAAERGIPLLETVPALSQPAGRFFDASDPVHPNEAGARRIADLLFERLRALGWLDAPARAALRPPARPAPPGSLRG